MDPAAKAEAGVQELVAWSDAQKARLVRAYAERWSAWSQRWLVAPGQGAEAAARVEEVGPLGAADRAGAVWGFTAASVERPTGSAAGGGIAGACEESLARHLFPDATRRAGRAPMTRAVARDALDDWFATLEAWLGVRPEAGAGSMPIEPDGGFAAQWSGCLLISAPWPGGTWHLYLAQHRVRELIGATSGPALVSPGSDARPDLAPAILDRALGIRVSLSEVSLSLGQLRDLRLGDLVTLTHALDAPAFVTIDGGTTVGRAWLGRKEGRVAAEFVDPGDLPHGAVPPARPDLQNRTPSEIHS